MPRSFCWALWPLLLVAGTTSGLDHVSFERDGKVLQVSGKLVVEAQDGGVLVEDRTGRLWAVTGTEKTALAHDDTEFSRFQKEELGAELLRELPDGFRLLHTAHYTIAYNTSPVYAEWCGALLERLFGAFTNYWEKRDFPVKQPGAPLVALVFADRESYARYARPELGDATSAIIGYYSLASNRVTMYDLTGTDALTGGTRGSSADQISRILSRPEAERTVATVVHEATHQLVFNCGLQARYADIPLWLSEGLAIYFEAPDLQNSKGWRGIGNVHRSRLVDFRRSLANRPADSLSTMLTDDSRLRSAQTVPAAYAEAWLVVHFLLKRYPQQFQEYMRLLANKKPLFSDEKSERLADFQRCFGKDPRVLDNELLRYAASLR